MKASGVSYTTYTKSPLLEERRDSTKHTNTISTPSRLSILDLTTNQWTKDVKNIFLRIASSSMNESLMASRRKQKISSSILLLITK